MIAKPTNTLLRRFISIAITVGVVLVYAKPLPDNDQAGGYLIQQQQQQQQQPNAGEEFVVAYGGDNPEYNLDSPEQNTEPSFGGVSNPTPTIQENPTPANGEPVAFEWWDSIIDGIRQKFEGMSAQKAMEDKFRNFDCGGAKSACCSGNSNNPGISGKHTCANKNKYHPVQDKVYAKISGSVPEGQFPCVRPVYLDTCDKLDDYKNYDCFSNCKAKPWSFGFRS